MGKLMNEKSTMKIKFEEVVTPPDNAKARKQIKKNKRLQRKELRPIKEDTKSEKALEYLSLWKDDRANWRFNKRMQIFLTKYCFDSQRIPDSNFDDLLEYLKDIKGNSRSMLLNSSKSVISKHDETTGEGEASVQVGQTSVIVNPSSYKRAKLILSLLS